MRSIKVIRMGEQSWNTNNRNKLHELGTLILLMGNLLRGESQANLTVQDLGR